MSDPVPQYLRDHARTLQKRPIFIADCTMRYGSEEGLTLLALKATDGRCDYPALLAEAREIVASGSAADRAPIDVVGLAWVARVMGGQPGPTGDFAEAADLTQALRILRAGRRLEPGQGLPGDIDRLEAQTNIAAGRLAYVEQVIPELVLADETRWMLDTELMHPDVAPGAPRRRRGCSGSTGSSRAPASRRSDWHRVTATPSTGSCRRSPRAVRPTIAPWSRS